MCMKVLLRCKCQNVRVSVPVCVFLFLSSFRVGSPKSNPCGPFLVGKGLVHVHQLHVSSLRKENKLLHCLQSPVEGFCASTRPENAFVSAGSLNVVSLMANFCCNSFIFCAKRMVRWFLVCIDADCDDQRPIRKSGRKIRILR